MIGAFTARILLAGGIATALAWICAPGVSLAKHVEEPYLAVTIVPDIGEEVTKSIDLSVIKENENYQNYEDSVKEETGMTVGRLLGLIGVAPDQLNEIEVDSAQAGSYKRKGKEAEEAVNGVPGTGGSILYPYFWSKSEAIEFVWPAKEPGETNNIAEGIGRPLAVTLKIKGGLLEVSRPSFSPAEPEAGAKVSFEAPSTHYAGGKVHEVTYSWSFADGDGSEAQAPTHEFHPQGVKGVYTYHVEVVATGRTAAGEVVAGSALVAVPVTLKETTKRSEDEGGGTHEEDHGSKEGQEGGSGSEESGSSGVPNSPKEEGPPSGSVDTPSVGVQPQEVAPGSSAVLSFSHGSGGRGGARNAAGHGRGDSTGKGTGKGKSLGTVAGKDDSAGQTHAADVTDSPARTDAPKSVRRSRASSPAADLSDTTGLVGVLLDAQSSEPAAALENAMAQADASPTLAEAAHGSQPGGAPVGLLSWIIGVLGVVALLTLGGLAETWPLARHRRLVAG